MLPAITLTAQASTNRHTRDEAVTWVQNKIGTAEDYPGSGFGAQCVDLICFYYEYLGQSRVVGNANDYMSNALPPGWTRYMNGQTTPQPGDIVVYDAYKYGALDVGHIGIVTENSPQDYKYIDYNGCGGNGVGYACPGNLIHGAWSSPCCGGIGALRVKQLHEFSCVIRPDWPSSDSAYEFDAVTGTVTISGTNVAESPVKHLGGAGVTYDEIKRIVIKNGVTDIARGAFAALQELTDVTIPYSVTSIGDDAFADCENLNKIVIPGSVASIGSNAFNNCQGLTHVAILDGVASIGDGAFSHCASLRGISIPKSITSIGVSAFPSSRPGYSSLSDVYYGGSKSDWDAITIKMNNDNLINAAKIHYNSTYLDIFLKELWDYFVEELQKLIVGFVCIRCPVDVEIFVNDQSVGQIVNNVASDVDTNKIYVHVENDEKYIYFLTSEEFTINLTATGEGRMEYSVRNLDVSSWDTLSEKNFREVELTPGKKMVSYVKYLDSELIDAPNTQLYVLGDNDSPIKKVLPDDKGTEVPLGVRLITFDANGGSMSTASIQTGTDGKLASWPTPTRTGYTFNGWFISSSGGTPLATDAVFTEDTTVYAQWTAASSNPDPTPGPNNPVGPTNPGGSWNDYTPTTTYTITTPTTPNGTVTVSPKSASKGSTVTITATPDTGYQLTTLTVTDNNGKEVSLTDKGSGAYAFTMPGGKVSINAVFQPMETSWSNPFTDVSTGVWYYDAVKFVSENGLMNGVGNSLFAPEENLSRGMLTQILYNKEGQPTVDDNSTFADVASGAWYFNAVSWASEKGIAGGYGTGLFGPNDNITREQLAVMLWRYAGKPVPPNLLLNFTDANLVSGYAMDAMRWAVDKGIINGKGNGILDPRGYATRAETAQMLKNYLSK